MSEINHVPTLGSAYFMNYPMASLAPVSPSQSYSYLYPTSPSIAGSSSQPSTDSPTFIVSDDAAPLMPLYAYHPAFAYLHSQGGQASAPGNESSVEEYGGGLNIDSLPGNANFLLPDPHPEIQRTSSAGSTRYDDDQDMDSIDTHSIASMSSGHDSIPEMGEMSPTRDGNNHQP